MFALKRQHLETLETSGFDQAVKVATCMILFPNMSSLQVTFQQLSRGEIVAFTLLLQIGQNAHYLWSL